MPEQTASVSSDPGAVIDAALDKLETGPASQSEPAENVAEPVSETSEEAVDSETTKTDVSSEDEVKDRGAIKDPVRERLARQRDAERQKSQELSNKIQQFEKQIAEWQGVMNRPEVVRARMKDQGYTDEAINAKLKDLGHEVREDRPDVFGLLKSKLGINPDSLQADYKPVLEDIGKIVDIMLEDRMQRLLPNQIAPLEKNLTELTRRERAKEMFTDMKSVIAEEGVLDFEKDVTPELKKFMDENPEALQEDIFEHFKDISRKISLERLRAKDKKVERSEKKEVLKGKVQEGGAGKINFKPSVSFKDNPNQAVNELLDSFGIR